MNKNKMYDHFSNSYDRFVNWDSRLSAELPFLSSELNKLSSQTKQTISVLDAACGTGRHVIALVNQGFNCSGADYSSGMIKIARENAKKWGLEVPFKEAGFGELTDAFEENEFDGLICLGNSLPHILEEQAMQQSLNDFRQVLKTGGKLIIQNRNFDRIVKERIRWMPAQTYREGDQTWIFTRFYDFEADGRLTFNIMVLHSSDNSEFDQEILSTRLWPIQKDQLLELLKESGFEDFACYGNLEGDEFVSNLSDNLVVTARAI